MTLAVLAAGVSLAGTGAYLQFRDDGTESAAAPSTSAGSPRTTRTPPARTTLPPAKPSATRSTKSGKSTKSEPVRRATRPATPVRLTVPSLDVSARVVGIRTTGRALIPPSNPRVLGWWSQGAKPGAAKGSAVITGHTVHDGGGAFDDLEQLQPGDTVTVGTARGGLRYVVESVTTYRKKALARYATRVFDQTVPGRLVLVTCEDWDGTAYLSNAVVIARPST